MIASMATADEATALIDFELDRFEWSGPDRLDVTFQPGEGITGIHLTVEGTVPGLDNDAFVAAAEEAKKNCPVSQALAGTRITLDAKLA